MADKIKYLFLMIITVAFFTGCWDNIEPENRAFAILAGIDRYESQSESEASEEHRFTVSVEFPEVEALTSKSSEDSKSVKEASGKTITEAIQTIDSSSSKKIYFGHLKTAVIGKGILEDERLFKEAIDALQRNKEVSKKLLVFATDEKSLDILEMDAPEDSMVGLFLSNFYKKNNDVLNAAFKQDLDSITGDLEFDGNVILPKIYKEGDQLKIGGAAVMKNFKLAGWLSDTQMRGFLLFKGDGEGAVITVEYQDILIPVNINKNKSDIHFYEEAGSLVCRTDIQIQGNMNEFIYTKDDMLTDEDLAHISKLCSSEIEKEIGAVFILFQKDFKTDGFRLSEHFRKFYYDLYLKYGENWEENFAQIRFEVVVETEIQSSGVLK